MFPATSKLLSGINELINYIQSDHNRIEFLTRLKERTLTDQALQEEVRSFHNENIAAYSTILKKKRYSNAIISLYGLLEIFIEEIIRDYIDTIRAQCSSFKELPDSIRDNHIELSMQLLKKVSSDRSIPPHEREQNMRSIIANLHSCDGTTTAFFLNNEAFSLHTANFRYESIQEAFSRVAADQLLQRCIKDDNLSSKIAKSRGVDSALPIKNGEALLKSILGDLAQRRNEIAHGRPSNNIEDKDIIIEKASILKSLGDAIDSNLRDNYYRFLVSKEKALALGNPARVFPKKQVIGFLGSSASSIEENLIHINDTVVHLSKGDKQISAGKITGLHINKQPVGEIQIPSANDFTIQVSFATTASMEGGRVYLVPSSKLTV